MDKQEAIQLLEEMKQFEILKCVACNSPFIKKRGKQCYKDGSVPKQKYSCNECGKYFVFEPLHYRKSRKVNIHFKNIVSFLHKKNYSIRDIKKILKNKYNFKISGMTIWRNIHIYKN